MRHAPSAIAGAAAMLAAASPALASTIAVDTLTGLPYHGNLNFANNYAGNPGPNVTYAQPFTSAASGFIQTLSFQGRTADTGAPPPDWYIKVYTLTDGLPDTLLGAKTFPISAFPDDGNTTVSLASKRIHIDTGADYAIAFGSDNPTFIPRIRVHITTTGASIPLPLVSYDNDQTFEEVGFLFSTQAIMMQVAVPGPGAAMPMLLAGAALARRRRP